jgi:hypothetical protein
MDNQAVFDSLSRFKHLLYKVTKWTTNSGDGWSDTRELVSDLDEANIITSQLADKPGYHTVMLDLDVPAKLVPSSTDGNSHLYIDVEVDWHSYVRLLHALAECGIIERGYLNVSVKNHLTSLRLPWVKREDPRKLSFKSV